MQKSGPCAQTAQGPNMHYPQCSYTHMCCNTSWVTCCDSWYMYISVYIYIYIYTCPWWFLIYYGWHGEFWGMKVLKQALECSDASCPFQSPLKGTSEGVFWMLVQNLLLAALSLAKSKCNLVSPVDWPPSFPGSLSEIRVHERHTLEHPEGRDVRWDEMNSVMISICIIHDFKLIPVNKSIFGVTCW